MRTPASSEGMRWVLQYLARQKVWPGIAPGFVLPLRQQLSEEWESATAAQYSASRSFASLSPAPSSLTAECSGRPATVETWRRFAQAAAAPHPVPHQQQHHAPVDPKQAATAPEDKVSEKAKLVFAQCWRRLEEKWQSTYQVPKEIVWLNGAPGSGKGANTPFILESRGLTRAVTMSSMLERHADIRELMDRGELVPDTMVGDALLDVIFDPDQADGAGLIVDGFPRTAMQVDLLKMLYDKTLALHLQHANTPEEWRFPRPSFKVVVLYVEQENSIRRQLMRAQLASQHNRRVADSGAGQLQELRATDADVAKCQRRYEIFKQHYSTLLRLKSYFPFSLIDACGTLEECRSQIARELRYQSSLDLGEATYAAIRHIPLAVELVRKSRQQLVSHLDSYVSHHKQLFHEVIRIIDAEAVPLLRRCSLAGHADLKTHNMLFTRAPVATDIFIDVLTDRGFSVAHVAEEQIVPVRFNLQTGAIESRVDLLHHFRITFQKGAVRSMVVGKSPSDAGDSLNLSNVPMGNGGNGQRSMGPFNPRQGVAAPISDSSAAANQSPTLAERMDSAASRAESVSAPPSAAESAAVSASAAAAGSEADAAQRQNAAQSQVLAAKLAGDEARAKIEPDAEHDQVASASSAAGDTMPHTDHEHKWESHFAHKEKQEKRDGSLDSAPSLESYERPASAHG